MLTGDNKCMLNEPGQTLNSSIKHYNLDNIFIYKTEKLYTYSNYLNAAIAPCYEPIGEHRVDLKIKKLERETLGYLIGEDGYHGLSCWCHMMSLIKIK